MLVLKSTYLSRTSIRTQIAHVEVWLYTHVHKHLPVDVKVTKFSYFRAAGKYKDMRTGPHHVFDMKVGKNWILLILFILFWIRKDCFIYSEKKTISCSLDPATNSETRKRKIQDFLVLQVFRLDETKNLRQKIQFPSKNQKDLSSIWSITFRRYCTLYQYASQSTAMWCLIDRNHDYRTNINSSLPVWSTSSVQVIEKFDCWSPSIRIWISRANSHSWKGQFFYGVSQCLEYCNNWAVVPC